MEQFDCKEDYLDQIKEQIRYKKVRSIITNEIDQHIEDQKASYIKEGDDENTAMVKALEQMGDPIEVGKQLDKIHRPRMEWCILLVTFSLCCLGILAQFSIEYSTVGVNILYSYYASRHILFLVIGILLMIAVYFLNYSIIGKYPKIIWALLLAGFFLYAPFGYKVNGQLPYLYAYGMLLIPAYGGILFAYKNKGYLGVIKCLLLSIVATIVEMRFVVQKSLCLSLFLSSLIMITVAVKKNWFGSSKKLSLVTIWGLPIGYFLLLFYGLYHFSSYQIARIHWFIKLITHPGLYRSNYPVSSVENVISHAKLFGKSTISDIGSLPDVNSNFALTYLIGRWGIVVGMLTIVLFIVFVSRLIYITYHQKNSLGMFVGLGCSLVFAAQGIIYIISNLGYQLFAQVNLPFVSYGNSSLFINFIVLGIILSVFRNTNIQKEVLYKQKIAITFISEKIK